MEIITDYLDSKFLVGIASNKLRVCIDDPRFPLKSHLREKSPMVTDRSQPRIIYAHLSANDHDQIQNEIQIRPKWHYSTCSVKLKKVVRSESFSPYVRPHNLFRELNEYVWEVLGKSGYLILVLYQMHRISHEQAAFLSCLLKYSKLHFGVILATHPEFLRTFSCDSPEPFSDFLGKINCIINSTTDLNYISSRRGETFVEGVQKLKKKNYKQFGLTDSAFV